MPYTPEELQNLPWYQNLLEEDEQKYLVKRNFSYITANSRVLPDFIII